MKQHQNMGFFGAENVQNDVREGRGKKDCTTLYFYIWLLSHSTLWVGLLSKIQLYVHRIFTVKSFIYWWLIFQRLTLIQSSSMCLSWIQKMDSPCWLDNSVFRVLRCYLRGHGSSYHSSQNFFVEVYPFCSYSSCHGLSCIKILFVVRLLNVRGFLRKAMDWGNL